MNFSSFLKKELKASKPVILSFILFIRFNTKNVTRRNDIWGNATRENEIRGNVTRETITQGNEIRRKITRGIESRGNVTRGMRFGET
jgi:hypothetical protein